jgi:hypothetical protein
MALNKTIMPIVVLACLIAPLQRIAGSPQTKMSQEKIDLTGEWVGESSCKGTQGRRYVKIEHRGTEVIMTNLTESECYKKGEWLLKGSFTENPFKVIINAFSVDNPNVKTTYDGYAEVIGNDSIKISIPNPRAGNRRLVRGTTILIKRVTAKGTTSDSRL